MLDKLRNTELTSVVWDANTKFHKAVKDLSNALGFPIRLQHRVVQMNTVELRFSRAPAETILATLCNGFDLRYVIHGGEVVLYKKITPTEERFLKVLAGLVDEEQAARILGALQPILASAGGR